MNSSPAAYQQAATIIIMIFALVLAVERLGAWARARALSS
jgi:ABC-type phosphate/phosphonate transport system permease subunit